VELGERRLSREEDAVDQGWIDGALVAARDDQVRDQLGVVGAVDLERSDGIKGAPGAPEAART
jgi:hypothetical protein